MKLSVKTLGALGIACGLLGVPCGLHSRPAGWLLAAGAILLGIAALLRHAEQPEEDEPRSQARAQKPQRIAYVAILSGAIGLLVTVIAAACGWSLTALLV